MNKLTNILSESRIAPKKNDILAKEFPFTTKTYIETDVSFLSEYIEDYLDITLGRRYNRFTPQEEEYITSYEDILDSYGEEVISYKSYIDYITGNRFDDYFKTREEKNFILSTNDVYELRDFINRKAKELSQEEPSDFKYYQEDVLDVVDIVKEKLSLFTKLLVTLKDQYYTLDNINGLSVFIERVEKELHIQTIERKDGAFKENKNIILRIK
jgi:hypothetical protein